MRTIRRLYFYAVALVSLEVVVWGVIGLARTVLAANLVGGAHRPAGAIVGLDPGWDPGLPHPLVRCPTRHKA